MKTYILVHGAWHGAWVWQSVSEILKKAGHRAYAPDLPGHGEQPRAFKEITLDTYVQTVVQMVRSLSDPVILVGHSMGGAVISQVAEHVPHLIQTLVYVAGFIPDPTGSIVEEEEKALHPGVSLHVKVDPKRFSLSLQHALNIQDLFYGNCSQDVYTYARSRLQDQPLKPFRDKVHLTDKRFGIVPKIYVECRKDQAVSILDQRRMRSKIPCDVFSLNADHSPFFSDRDNLCQILMDNT